MIRTARRSTLVATFAALGLLLSACGDSGATATSGADSPPASAPGQPSITTASTDTTATTGTREPSVTQPSSDDECEAVIALDYAGIRSGVSGLIAAVLDQYEVDKANGMDWTVNYLETDEATRQLLGGRTHLGIIGGPAVLTAAEALPTISVVRPLYWMHGSILVAAESPYEGLADLAGETVVFGSPLSGIRVAADTILRLADGIEPEDVDNVEANPTVGLNAVAQGDAAATVAWVPITNRVMLTGDYRELVFIKDAYEEFTGDQMVNGVAVADRDWLEATPCAEERVKATLGAATRYILDHPEVFEDPEIQEILGIESEEEVDPIRSAVERVLVPDWTDADTDAQLRVLEDARELEAFPYIEDDVLEAMWSNVGEFND